MPKLIPLFNGGMYKRGIEDGRNRKVLTALEAELIFHDPEVPGMVAPTSIGTELNMSKYFDSFCDLEVGDEILVGLIPDASIVRALWMMSHHKVDGFTGTFDLVSVPAIAAAVEAAGGNLADPSVLGIGRVGTTTNQVVYDATNGLIGATKDAVQQLEIYGGVYTDYRNNAALAVTNFATAIPLPLAEPVYMRYTISAIGNLGVAEDGGCCSTCAGQNYPTFQFGAVYDVLCVDKQRVENYCNCPENLNLQRGCDEVPDTTPPIVGPFVNQTGTVGVPFVFDLNATTPSETIVTWTAVPLPAGLSIDSGTGVISGTPFTTGTTAVIVTGLDAAGNLSATSSFDIVIA